MRRLLTLGILAVFTFFGSTALAQQQPQLPGEEQQMDLQLGIVGAGNLTTFMGDDTEDLAFKPGFGAGIRGIINFHRNFGLQPEVLFMQRGTAFDELDDTRITLNYIHVPVLLRINFPMMDGMVIPKVLVGPTVGALVGGSLVIAGESQDVDDDNYETLDVGATAGVGVDFDMGMGTFSLDARYNQTFLDITVADGDTYNSAIDVLLGYNFRF